MRIIRWRVKSLLLGLCALFVLTASVSVSAQLTYSQFAVAAGNVFLDGSNPTSVTTGLSDIRSCTVNVISSTFTPATGGEPVSITVVPHATRGQLDIYAWDTADPPAASTTTLYNVSYICIGSI